MGTKRLVTIADIAKAANVSPATVSRFIHGNGYVSKEKRIAIENAINKLGYVPNKVARGLRNKQTNLIGHVLPLSNDNPFFARIATAIEEQAYKAGYHVLTVMTQDSAEKEHAMIEDLCGLMVEAIIFTGKTACETSFIQQIASRGIPIVLIERPRDIPEADIVFLDSFEGSRQAAEHIISRGHTRIAYIGSQFSYGSVEQSRFEGFATTLAAHGLSCPKHWCRLMPDYTAEYGYQAMEQILNTGDVPSCVFATSDLFACGVLQCLYDRNLRVPEDISLVGYDNTLSALSSPPLTTIELQPSEIAIAAMNMILERTNDQRNYPKMVTISPFLVDRNSVRHL